MKIRRPSHTTIVAYVALFGVIATGGAYAVDKIGSNDIKRSAVSSQKIKNKTIRGKDVKPDALRGKQIREDTLKLAGLARVAGGEFAGCNPSSTTPIDCGTVTVELSRPGRILAVASAGQYSDGGPASARCDIRVDGQPTGIDGSAGETSADNTGLGSANGFARTVVSDPLSTGTHAVTLICAELAGDAQIESPTLAAIAVTGP